MQHDRTQSPAPLSLVDSMQGSLSRRAALGGIAALGASAIAAPALAQDRRPGARNQPRRQEPGLSLSELGWDDAKAEYVLPRLPYPHDALEPHIDAQTMRIHHERHHAGYVNNLNKALRELEDIRSGSGDTSLVSHWERQLAFNGGGHVNHTLFWLTMAPPDRGGGGEPEGELADAIRRDFGSFDGFRTHMKAAASSVEGSGWGWLMYEPVARRLIIAQMEKQQNLLFPGAVPLLGVDVWEHAYYLKYQNNRGDYIDAWMKVINWPMVSRLYDAAARRA